MIGVYVHGSWRYIPAIFACGIGIVFLRSAAGAYVQRLKSQP
jgi:fucose permease